MLPHVQDMYRRGFLTEAFQCGLLITFFLEMERLDKKRDLEGMAPVDGADRKRLFDEYVAQVNDFFRPKSGKDAWKRILRVFIGDVTGAHGAKEPVVVPSSKCLRRILVPRELKPDEWTKFRYMFLELWIRQTRLWPGW